MNRRHFLMLAAVVPIVATLREIGDESCPPLYGVFENGRPGPVVPLYYERRGRNVWALSRQGWAQVSGPCWVTAQHDPRGTVRLGRREAWAVK